MPVGPFTDFDLDDDVALDRYLDAHARRHGAYNVAMKISGGQELRGRVDADWMHRHAARTIALATFAAIDLSSADNKVLALPGKWRTQQELIDWMELDNRIHLKVDRQLKL
jgi:hypothetical protein